MHNGRALTSFRWEIGWKNHYVRAMLVVGAITAYAVAAGAGFRWY